MPVIKLSTGGDTLVDQQDLDLARFPWRNVNGYAGYSERLGTRHKNILLHRIVMQRMVGRVLERGEQVDHHNQERSDNRRANLRLANAQLNQANRRTPQNNTSGYKGVVVDPRSANTPFHAAVSRLSIGYFDTIEEAAWMYDQWALGLYGEFALTNFDYCTIESEELVAGVKWTLPSQEDSHAA